jgi:hypothetical protein
VKDTKIRNVEKSLCVSVNPSKERFSRNAFRAITQCSSYLGTQVRRTRRWLHRGASLVSL